MRLKKNIGSPGRLVRLALAVALLGLAYYKASWILAAVGLFVLYESLAGWCILYHFLGKNSCPK
jgi:hypothetical protein